jgi:uncharacterized protein (DUF1778 family)
MSEKFKSKKITRNKTIRFRITEDEKLLLEQNAILQGYSSVSEFMRFTLNNNCWNV